MIEWLPNLPFSRGSRVRIVPDPSRDYSPLNLAKDESEPFIESGAVTHASAQHPTRLSLAVPWLLSVIFMATSVSLYVRQGTSRSYGIDKFPLAHQTDFKSAHGEIDLEVVTFTGSPVFHENGTFYVPRPGHRTYIGTPSPAVDQAWEELTWGRYFRITEEEAITAFGDARDAYWNDKVGGYMAGIDMFHALHCLNRLRMTLWPEYYPVSTQRNTFIHREHCIDHIRQMLMCSGDMTLIPTEWSDHLQRNYVNSDVPHTCRNFGKLREWVSARHNGSTQVPWSPEKKHT